MNFKSLEKAARQVLSGKGANTVNLTSAERRAINTASWQIAPGSTSSGTWAIIRPNQFWG